LSKIGIPHNVVIFNVYADELKPFSAKEQPNLAEDIVGEVQRGRSYERESTIQGTDRHAAFWWSVDTIKHEDGKTDLRKFMGMIRGREAAQNKLRELNFEASKYGKSLHEMFYFVDGPGYNSDAEALIYARKLLLKQKGTKLMIFLSDGQPAPMMYGYESPIHPRREQHDFDVKKEVNNTIRSGVELYSVGIMDGSVTKFYPPRRTAAIKTLDQLYPHIIKLIKLNLKRG